MRVALVDDSQLFRSGLALLLQTTSMTVAWEAVNGSELQARMTRDPVDAVILDIRMPPTFREEGLDAAEWLRAEHPEAAILLLSTYAESHYAMRLLNIGPRAVGYLLKDRVGDVRMIADALERLSAGESVVDTDIVTRLVDRPRFDTRISTLSVRERSVLGLMAEGRSNAGIAERLHLSPKTVEANVNVVFTKLGLPPATPDNRRVLAVLAHLRAQPAE